MKQLRYSIIFISFLCYAGPQEDLIDAAEKADINKNPKIKKTQ